MTITLQIIRDHNPCTDDWKTLTKAIGSDLTTELSIGDVLISNGLDGALWFMNCLEPRVRVAAIMPAVKRTSVYTTDSRVHDCIADIERWLAGDDTVDLKAASEAARAARCLAGSWGAAATASLAAEVACRRAESGGVLWAAGAAQVAAGVAAGAAARAAGARAATRAAARAEEAERKLQGADLLAMFPPMILKGEQP